MDVAKAIAVLAINKAVLLIILPHKVPSQGCLNHDPTTAGTGSESYFYRGFCAEEFKKEGGDEQPLFLSGTGAS